MQWSKSHIKLDYFYYYFSIKVTWLTPFLLVSVPILTAYLNFGIFLGQICSQSYCKQVCSPECYKERCFVKIKAALWFNRQVSEVALSISFGSIWNGRVWVSRFKSSVVWFLSKLISWCVFEINTLVLHFFLLHIHQDLTQFEMWKFLLTWPGLQIRFTHPSKGHGISISIYRLWTNSMS